MNASKVVGKPLNQMKVVINGAGAAGIAIARLLGCVEHKNVKACLTVKDIIICDSVGIIHEGRANLTQVKKNLLEFTNKDNRQGDLRNALRGFDVFIGVSKGNLINADDVRTMADDAVILALANPTPEIMPEEAKAGGARIVGTGRSDFPNQVNNVLGFPGIFRGALEARAPRITAAMKLAAAQAIASCVDPTVDMIIPPTLNEEVAFRVARAVYDAAMKSKQ